jgi:hypothetical protein
MKRQFAVLKDGFPAAILSVCTAAFGRVEPLADATAVFVGHRLVATEGV